MMLLAIIITTISTLIQGTISNYIGYTHQNLSLFFTLYVLICLLIIQPYFDNKKKYFSLLIIFGLVIDITYTDTLFLNTSLFIIGYYFSKAFHFFFPYNLFTINISNLLSIFLYHIISFLFLSISQYDNYSIEVLLKVLSHSIIMTGIYTTILYCTVLFIKEKLRLENVK